MAKEKADNEPYVFSASQLIERSKNRKVITGLLSIDIGLGGGIPLGSTLIVGGKAKSGKTTTVLQYAANAQKEFGCDVYYANIEGRLDNKVLSQINGLNLEKVHVVMGPPIYDKTEKTKVIGNRKMTAQEWWAKIGEIITTKPGSIIIVDSISSLCDEAELTQGMGHQSRGGLQKLESQFCRQYGDLVMPNNITLFLLAQVQANTSGYGEPIQIKCGNSIRHLADGIIYIKNIKKWNPTPEGKIKGQDMEWRVDCSPMGPPFVDTTVPLRYGEGLDRAMDLMNNALSWEIIKGGGGGHYVFPFVVGEDGSFTYIKEFDKETENILKLRSEETCREWLKTHEEQMKIIEKDLRERIL